MDNNNINKNKNPKNNAPSQRELELKILREKVNKNKNNLGNNTQNPNPYKKYNPVNNDISENETLGNSNLGNSINDTASNKDLFMPNKNSDAFNNKDESSFGNKNIDSFDNGDGLEPKDSLNGNNELSPKDSINEDISNNNVSSDLSNSDDELNNQTNIVNRKRNAFNNDDSEGDTSTKDPFQRKLNRFNNQNKQQNDLLNGEPSTNNLNSTPTTQPNPNDKRNNTGSNQVGNKPQPNPTPSESKPGVNQNAKTSPKSPSTGGNSDFLGKLGAANQIKNEFDKSIEENNGDVKQAAKTVAKEEVKQVVKRKLKEKIVEFFINVILPILPYIGLAILIIFLVLLLLFAIMGVFDDENNVVDTIRINYCEYVNLKWGEEIDQNKTISSNEYIKYEINNSEYKRIDDAKALKALIIVLRTNLYANSDNLDSNVCYFEIDEEYEPEENELFDEVIEQTDNKVFSVSKTVLSELDIDDHFTYTSIVDGKYRLYQDKMSYNVDWVNSNITSDNISNDSNDVEKYSYSPFAAWYLSAVNDYDYLSLIFHFVTPGSHKGNIYKAVKIRSGDDDYGEYNACSDISLTSTPLERQEFIDSVNSSSASQTFKTNAGKIYDIATSNNFNPEMVVIRAELEGYSPGGSSYNYWGIGCTNSGGRKACKSYSSFDQGVVEYIKTVKKINSTSLYQMQYKYAYIGSNWFNPGGSGQGGCYYFPYIKKYMSESRVSEVESACASGATCSGSACLKTTDEDQSAYTRWQIEKSLDQRASIFGITADECSEEGEAAEDVPASEVGEAVAKYAVRTFDSWQYSQPNRNQDGFVDCSSLIYRAYRHFNIKVYDSGNSSGEIYRWCEKNGKTISGSQLAAGDLIFYNSHGHSNSHNYKGIGHVEMYIGNGQKFGAHTHYKTHPNDDVSVKTYGNDGNLFCRPVSK